MPSLLGKVAALPTEEVFAAGSVPTWRTLCKFLLNLGEMPSPRDVVIVRNLKRQRGASVKLK